MSVNRRDFLKSTAWMGALAMAAGNDLIMPGGKADKKEILEGVKSGVITEEDVKRCCERVVKAVMGSALQSEYVK